MCLLERLQKTIKMVRRKRVSFEESLNMDFSANHEQRTLSQYPMG